MKKGPMRVAVKWTLHSKNELQQEFRPSGPSRIPYIITKVTKNKGSVNESRVSNVGMIFHQERGRKRKGKGILAGAVGGSM